MIEHETTNPLILMNSTDYAKCIHCDISLIPPEKQPCPNCGKTGRKIYIKIEDQVNIHDDHVIQNTSGKTNRTTTHADSRNETDTVKIQKLIIDFVQNDANDLASYLEALVKSFDIELHLTNKVFYRAVNISVKRDLQSNQIGPSPSPCDGRYNRRGEKCLYLIDTIDFLYQELNSTSILIQKFNIPVSSLKIADLSPRNTSLDNSLALVFDMAESGRTSSGYCFEKELQNRGKSKNLVSQLLSSYFKKCSWDGLYIPGVHGGLGQHYHNLVIFGPAVDKWQTWADGQYFSMTRQ